MLTIEEYLSTRPDVTPEVMARAHERTLAYIKAYELAEARKASKVTQVQLAKKMGVSQKRISDLEHGELDSTQLGTLRRYIDGLGGTLHVVAELPDRTIEVL